LGEGGIDIPREWLKTAYPFQMKLAKKDSVERLLSCLEGTYPPGALEKRLEKEGVDSLYKIPEETVQIWLNMIDNPF